MLRKLVKYDLRSLSPVLLIIHIPFLLLIPAARFLGAERLLALQRPDALAIMVLILYFVYASFISLATEIYIAVFVYRNWFSREGYLTMTLPVTPAVQIGSKMLAAFLWYLADCILLVFSLWTLASAPGMDVFFGGQQALVLDCFAFWNPHTLGFYLMLTSVTGVFSGIALVLAVLCAGHCFSSHRVLTSVVLYFCITLVIQLLAGVAAFIFSFRYAPLLDEEAISSRLLVQVFGTPLLVLAAAGTVGGILCLVFSHYVLSRRLNLD